MKIEERKAVTFERNSFGQLQVNDLGFEKKYYEVTAEEFLKTTLPDGNYYGMKANDIIKSLMTFKSWEDPEDCKYVEFNIVDGKIVNIRDVEFDVYKSCLNFVKII